MMNFKDVDITIKRILCEFMGYDDFDYCRTKSNTSNTLS